MMYSDIQAAAAVVADRTLMQPQCLKAGVSTPEHIQMMHCCGETLNNTCYKSLLIQDTVYIQPCIHVEPKQIVAAEAIQLAFPQQY